MSFYVLCEMYLCAQCVRLKLSLMSDNKMDLMMFKRSILYAKVLLCVKYIPIRCFKVKRSSYEVQGLNSTKPKDEKRD